MEFAEFERRIERLESTLDRFFRGRMSQAAAGVGSQIADYNQWLDRTARQFDNESSALESERARLHEIKSQIDRSSCELEKESEPKDSAAIRRYNRKVREHNARIEEYERLAALFDERLESYNRRVERNNHEAASRREEIDHAERDLSQRADEYERWLENRGQEQFVTEVNGLYALLHHERSVGGCGDIDRLIDRVRNIRRELGEHAKGEQDARDNGLVIVPALLSGTEKAWMIVDTGASVVSVRPELVEVLGLTHCVGDPVEVRLAGGIRVEAPTVTLPAVSVSGFEAEGVEGVVLRETQPGLDGCLGLTFLNRFWFHIQKGKPSRLLLRHSRWHFLRGSRRS